MHNNMYEVFDSFLASQTWHRDKDVDRNRFYLALDKVVREAAFDPLLVAGFSDRENSGARR